MFLINLIVSLCQFALSVGLAVGVVFLSYKLFIRVNTRYDEEAEIKKGNVAVAVLLSSLLWASASIVQAAVHPVVNIIRIYLTSPIQQSINRWDLAAYGIAHLVLAFLLAVGTIWFALEFFDRLTSDVDELAEILKGNVAVAIVQATVVVILAAYIQDGVGALSKALLPQPTIGRVEIMR